MPALPKSYFCMLAKSKKTKKDMVQGYCFVIVVAPLGKIKRERRKKNGRREEVKA